MTSLFHLSPRWRLVGTACGAVLVVMTALRVPLFAERHARPQSTPAGRVTERLLELAQGRPIVMQAGMPLDVALLFVSRTAGVPIGFESARSASRPAIPPHAGGLTMTGVTVGQALDKLVDAVPGYGWSESGGVIQVRPAGGERSPLDDRLPTLTIRDVTLGDAVDRVIDAIAPEGYPRGSGWGGDRPGQIRAHVSVALHNPTVAEALAAIAGAHGASGWAVTYRTMHGTSDGLQPSLMLFTFDGAQFAKSLPPLDRWKTRR